MNYSRNIKKASIGKRVLISWVVVAIIFSLVGFGIGAICSKGGSSPEQTEPETQKEVLIDGKFVRLSGQPIDSLYPYPATGVPSGALFPLPYLRNPAAR